MLQSGIAKGGYIMNNEEKILTMLEALTQGQARMGTDISGLKTDVADLTQGQARMETDISGLKADVADLKQGHTELKQGQAELKQGLADLKREVSTNWDNFIELAESHHKFSQKLAEHL